MYNQHINSSANTSPNTVESGKIEAKYENGVLHINIPKKEEAKPKPVKVIEIQ